MRIASPGDVAVLLLRRLWLVPAGPRLRIASPGDGAGRPQLPLAPALVRLLEVEDHQVIVLTKQCPREGKPWLVVGTQGLHDRLQRLSLWAEEPFVQVRELDAPHPAPSRLEVAHLWSGTPCHTQVLGPQVLECHRDPSSEPVAQLLSL